MRTTNLLAAVAGTSLLLAASCSKSEKPAADSKGSAASTTTAKTDDPKQPDPAKPAAAKPAEVGVEAGGIEREADEGPAATITGISGTVELRRVGENEFAAAKLEDKLYPGDQVRTADASSVTVAFADESVAEIAEVTTIGIGSREGTADPGSSAAVLAGLARFSVTSRAAGEGPFRVYTPQGVILTKGTEYGVGVAASGEARVGVESGAVEVVGLSTMDAQPVSVETGAAATLAIGGTVAAPAPWPEDDWGTWRDEVDVKVDASATIDAIGASLAKLEADLAASYVELDATATDVATFEASASASADKGDTAAYEASLPEGSATIDASFGVAGRVEALTWAYAGNATLAGDIYVRHPEVEAKYVVIAPRVDAAVLWPKRYEVTATAYLEPLRTQYYVHHPRGRAHAQIVGVAVPEFYANVNVPELDRAKVRGHVKVAMWTPPTLQYEAKVTRPVYVVSPPPDWSIKMTGRYNAAPPRAKVAWYVRPQAPKAKLVVGANIDAKVRVMATPKFKVSAPSPRAAIRASWKIPVGMKVKIAPPDLKAQATARAGFKGGVVMGGGVRAGGGVKVKAPDIKAPDMGVNVRDHRGEVKGKLDGKLGGMKAKVGGGMKVDGGVKVKIKAPPPPSVDVKVKVKGKAGIKF